MERLEIAELAQDINLGTYMKPHEGRSYLVLTVTDIYHNRHQVTIPCSAIGEDNMLARLLEQLRAEAESELKAITKIPGLPLRGYSPETTVEIWAARRRLLEKDFEGKPWDGKKKRARRLAEKGWEGEILP